MFFKVAFLKYCAKFGGKDLRWSLFQFLSPVFLVNFMKILFLQIWSMRLSRPWSNTHTSWLRSDVSISNHETIYNVVSGGFFNLLWSHFACNVMWTYIFWEVQFNNPTFATWNHGFAELWAKFKNKLRLSKVWYLSTRSKNKLRCIFLKNFKDDFHIGNRFWAQNNQRSKKLKNETFCLITDVPRLIVASK